MNLNLIIAASLALLSLGASADTITQENFANSKLLGSYSLVSAEGGGRQRCSSEVQVAVDQYQVEINDAKNGNQLDAFRLAHAGCTHEEGDIGPVRNRCVEFTDSSASSSDSQPISLVGYVSETHTIRLGAFDSDKLVFKHTSTMIPFGFMNIDESEKFTCIYKRN